MLPIGFCCLILTFASTSFEPVVAFEPVVLSRNLLEEVGIEEPIEIEKSLQTERYPTRACFHKYVIMRETRFPPMTSETWKEYEVVFDAPAPKFEDASHSHKETTEFNLTDLDTGEVRLARFVTIFKNSSVVVRKHTETHCGEGKFLVKRYSSWDAGKRVTIKLTDKVDEDVREFDGFLGNTESRAKTDPKDRTEGRLHRKGKSKRFDESEFDYDDDDRDLPKSLNVGKSKSKSDGWDTRRNRPGTDRLGESAPLNPEDDAKGCSGAAKVLFQLFRFPCGLDFDESGKINVKGGYVVSKKVMVEDENGGIVEKDKHLFAIREDSNIELSMDGEGLRALAT
ncbi:uncharacterized protein LOC132707073 [Cylas formicarius]|uniref:uncharacterized protein LOC132707073 n=1 Tax=Cylas formicarius TaxID=197179 RepID=UPI0029586A79|nr:uncharacterized protein LOC132707073 [Cylas formicarius]